MENNISYDVQIIAREYHREPGLERTFMGEKLIKDMRITEAAFRDVRKEFDTAEEALLVLVKMVL